MVCTFCLKRWSLEHSCSDIRYDGVFTDFPGQPRQWTVLGHFLDAKGIDRHTGSFFQDGLEKLGIVREAV